MTNDDSGFRMEAITMPLSYVIASDNAPSFSREQNHDGATREAATQSLVTYRVQDPNKKQGNKSG